MFGNRTKKVTLDKTHNYAYNASGQLGSVNLGTSNVTYKYNADGARCSKTVDGVTTEYYLDGDKILGEKHVSEDYSLYFIYDALGISSIEYEGIGYKLVKDQQNNVIALLNNLGDLVARYEYDAFGNCKIFNKYGADITNTSGIANINPYRWKSFYFDTETGLYYANGSYYDPEVGQYLDSAPIETVADNAFSVGNLDRNAPVCDNILELACNPHTSETTQELSADGTYNILDDLTTLGRLEYKIRQGIEKFTRFLNKLHWGIKLLIGAGLLVGAILLTIFSQGSLAPLFIELAIGIGITVVGYLVSSLINGEFDWEAFANTVANAFLLTSVTLFVSAGVKAIRYAARCTPYPEQALTQCSGNCFIAGTLILCLHGYKKIEDIKIGDIVLSYNEETGKREYKPVVRLFRNESKDWVKVKIADDEIESTLGHKYYLPLVKQWVSACDLHKGDFVLLSNGDTVKIQSIEFVHYDTSQTTYNFEVADCHTYYVQCGVLVHNKNCKRAAMREAKRSENIPMSAKPSSKRIDTIVGADGRNYQTTVEFYGPKFIRDDFGGHKFADGTSLSRHYNSGTWKYVGDAKKCNRNGKHFWY